MQKVFTCTNFKGRWPVGTAAVVVANNEAEARHVLHYQLMGMGLNFAEESAYKINEVDTSDSRPAHAIILRDGDY